MEPSTSEHVIIWQSGWPEPKFVPPPGSVDTHCHAFGPMAQFPSSPQAEYLPEDAGRHMLFALRNHFEFSRNVIEGWILSASSLS